MADDPTNTPDDPAVTDGANESQPPADPADSALDAEAAVEAAQSAVADVQAAVAEAGSNGNGKPLNLPAFEPTGFGADAESRIAFLGDVNLNVKIELGRTRMYVEDVLRMNSGSVIELDKPAGDPVDIFINDRHIARGEVLVVNDNFCVRISEILEKVTADED